MAASDDQERQGRMALAATAAILQLRHSNLVKNGSKQSDMAQVRNGRPAAVRDTTGGHYGHIDVPTHGPLGRGVLRLY